MAATDAPELATEGRPESAAKEDEPKTESQQVRY
jgi:hypothetical protein